MRAPMLPAILFAVALVACKADPAEPDTFPPVVALPNGFAPEGMSFDTGSTVYVGSILTGAIWRGDVRTGQGSVLVPATSDRSATGIKYDLRGNRLFVAGGMTGQAYVYDASSGATLASYQLAASSAVESGQTLVNDVVIVRDAAYFTDSYQAVLYRLPLGTNGALPAVDAIEAIPLSGDYALLPSPAFNGTGIAATPDGQHLILMNSEEGVLYRVDPRSGSAATINTGAPLTFGDGIVRDGQTLYVVQAAPDQVTVVHFNSDFTAGTIERVITDSSFAFPTAVGDFDDALYVLNGRFDVAPPGVPAPDVQFQLVRVTR